MVLVPTGSGVSSGAPFRTAFVGCISGVRRLAGAGSSVINYLVNVYHEGEPHFRRCNQPEQRLEARQIVCTPRRRADPHGKHLLLQQSRKAILSHIIGDHPSDHLEPRVVGAHPQRTRRAVSELTSRATPDAQRPLSSPSPRDPGQIAGPNAN
jgi:hypothetical protein